MSDTHNIIIKKVKKVSGDGHHGGAWKVAYADFVTAMMAFFLLMWLLNATTEDQRKGIADYFNPSIPVSTISGGGTDVLNGSSVFSTDNLAKDGTGGDGKGEADKEAAPEDEGIAHEKFEHDVAGDAHAAAMEAIEADLRNQIAGENDSGLGRHMQIKVTPEGMVIDLVDTEGSALFQVGSNTPSPKMRLLLSVVANTLTLIEMKSPLSVIRTAVHLQADAITQIGNFLQIAPIWPDVSWRMQDCRANKSTKSPARRIQSPWWKIPTPRKIGASRLQSLRIDN